jgi:hypothetical protein
MPDATGVGTGIVILIPLKVSSNVGKGGKFINAFASSIPNILGGTPDILTGFPDVQVTGLTSWNVADILQSDRPFYTWTAKDGTRVIVMAEPIGIADGDMTNIKRLPITTPGDAIHDIADNIFYKAAPPIDCAGNPLLCKKPFNIVQPQQYLPENSVSGGKRDVIMGGVGILWSFFLACFAAWIAIMLATGTGAKIISGISDGISKIIGAAKVAKPAAPAPAKPAAPAPNEPPVNPMFKPKPRSEPSA